MKYYGDISSLSWSFLEFGIILHIFYSGFFSFLPAKQSDFGPFYRRGERKNSQKDRAG